MNKQIENNDPIYNIVLCWTYLEWGGAQIYFLSIIKNAPPNWRFTIVLPEDSKSDIIEFFEPFGVKFEFLDSSYKLYEAEGLIGKLNRQRLRLKSEISVYKKLKGLNLENQIFHIESAPWQSWILIFLLSKFAPVFVTMHNAIPIEVSGWRKKVWSKRLNFLLKQRNFKIFAANQNTIESLKNFVVEKFWDKLILTRASINPREIENVRQSDFEKNKLMESHQIPNGKFIILCVGQFIDRKGRWIFLEAIQKIIKTRKDLFFVWLMPQLPNDEEQKQIDQFGINDFFKPVLSADVGKKREEILQFFKIADVFTLASLWEGLPIAILEAMSLGIPTVSTNLNAIPEAVIDNKTGLLVKLGDSDDLAEAILRLYKDKNLCNFLGKSGREFVIVNFDEKYWAQIALENYKECLTV